MNAIRFKTSMSAAIIVSVCIIIPCVGITASEIDEIQGVMIDYGYYNVDWVDVEFESGMTGLQALEAACAKEGYPLTLNMYGEVASINGESNYISSGWNMFYLTGKGDRRGWVMEDDPYSTDISDQKLIAWARTENPSDMMPGVDQTGFTYYSYSQGGLNSEGEPLRIVTMAPSVTETVVAVGGMDMIVATDKYSNYPDEIYMRQKSEAIQLVGGYTDPNYELVVSADPDIVFMDGSVGEHVAMADKLRKSGINVVVLYEVIEISDLLKNVWIAASAIGASDTGNEYNKQVTATIDALVGITNIQSCRAFIALSDNDSPYVAGSSTYAHSIMEALGATNVFSDVEKWEMVDKESIYDQQPDVIIILYGGKITSEKQYIDVIRGLNKNWKDTPAYSDKHIVLFSGKSAELLSRPGARLAAAAELIAKSLDPDAFTAADYWDRCPLYFGDDYGRYLTYQGEEGVLLK